MRRLLLVLVVFAGVILALRRLSGLLSPGTVRARRAPRAPRPRGGELVRDRVCDTFLPGDRALVLRDGSQVLYFCSETCRDRHRNRARGSDAA